MDPAQTSACDPSSLDAVDSGGAIREAAAAAGATANASGTLTDSAVVRFARITGAHEATTSDGEVGPGSRGRQEARLRLQGHRHEPGQVQGHRAQVLDNTSVAAYAGQGPKIQREFVKAALSIHSVEARHAAWIRFINGGGADDGLPAPEAFDGAKSEKAVLGAVGATGS